MDRWAMVAAAALTLCRPALAAGAAAPAPAPQGSLYPKTGESRGRIEAALGPAGYILALAGADEAFRADVRRAIGTHPAFHQEAARRDDARAHVRAERAALYPRLSGSLSGDYVLAREFGSGTDNVVESLRPGGQVNAGVSASQLIFDGGAVFARIKGARAHDKTAALSIDARVNELALSALSAHHDLATHQAVLKAGEAYIARHEALLADVRERDRLGAGSKVDVFQASARLAAARARVSQIRESTRLAEIRYWQFFKREPGLLARPSFAGVAVASRADAARLAGERNPEIGVAAGVAAQAQAEYKAAKAARLPELRASVNATKFDVLAGSGDYDVRAGVNLNYDIFNGGARAAAIGRAAAVARQQKFGEARVREEIERDAMIAFEAERSAEERLAALGDAVVANADARRLVAERFRAARGELIDVLQAENDYFEAIVAYLAGLAGRDMAVWGLMEHTGDLLRNFSPGQGPAESERGDG
jgi:adhesin transport system outer membrane protein